MNAKRIVSSAITAIAIVGTAAIGRLYYQNAQVPRLGVSQGRLQPLDSKPHGVSTQTNDMARRVEPWKFLDSPAATMAAVKAAVIAYGGSAVKVESDDYLYVVFTTPLLKFHDDAEFWLDSASQQVEFRSSSRAGYSDMGLNRQRYQKLSELYLQESPKVTR